MVMGQRHADRSRAKTRSESAARREHALSQRISGVEHVRAGQPLTPRGAALLGVAWPQEASA